MGERLGRALAEAGLGSVADLLLHVPRRYIDRSVIRPIGMLRPGEEVTVVGTVSSISSRRTRHGRNLVEALVVDQTGVLKVGWFNQPYREKQLRPGTEVALFGKVESFGGKPTLTNPVTEPVRSKSTVRTGRIVPLYPTVAGLASWRIQALVEDALVRSRPILDPVPPEVVTGLGLLDRDTAFELIHAPSTPEDVERARARLVFDELFRIELALAMAKHRKIVEAAGIAHAVEGELVDRFLSGLPYRLTGDQEKVLAEIRADLARPHPMHRLLQGEVGSGKTVVAVAALLCAIQGGYQGAVMAPTEVLATQHFLGICSLLEQAGLSPSWEGRGAAWGMESLFAQDPSVRVGLLTASQAVTNFGVGGRDELLAWIADGKVDLVVGTHALIQEGVGFARLGMAVIDEQHRFGVAQRLEMQKKAGEVDPDLLIMTATPIPRTLSMTLYGDLDVSVIAQLPPGRSPIRTQMVPKSEEDRVWQVIRGEVSRGRQAYVVCPLVEDSPKVEAASAAAEYERLSLILPDLRVGLLHGQLPAADKHSVMEAFRRGDLDVLVATTVIEVGIDVPNATVIVIQDAERFGLSQLHQLRGRVGRGTHPGRCILIADPTTEEAERRIQAMLETGDGFRLAEEDLKIRSHGTLFGTRQSGLPDLKLADLLADFDMLVEARREAFRLIGTDPGLERHPELRREVQTLLGEAVAWLFVS